MAIVECLAPLGVKFELVDVLPKLEGPKTASKSTLVLFLLAVLLFAVDCTTLKGSFGVFENAGLKGSLEVLEPVLGGGKLEGLLWSRHGFE